MAWANLYPRVYCGLREYEIGLGQNIPRGINWPRPHYTQVYSGLGYILACYTGMCDKVYVWSKLAKNSVTYFLDGPIDTLKENSFRR